MLLNFYLAFNMNLSCIFLANVIKIFLKKEMRYMNLSMNESKLLNTKLKTILAVLIIYVICFAFRALEYFVIRTDQTFFGEAFIHKLIGIGLFIAAIFVFHYKFEDIGFKTGKSFFDILKGLAFGLVAFIIAYGVEIIIFAASNNLKAVELYVTAYSVDGVEEIKRTGFIFFLICIIGNVINVFMEEGVFRGLFQKMLSDQYKFFIAAIIASVLFGLWHIIAPLRSFIDGNKSVGGFIGESIMLIGTSALVGFKFAMIGKLTGNLYMGIGDHFVNNTIVNILHVINTEGEADQLTTVRISIAQSVSFTAVLIWFIFDLIREKKIANQVPVEQ